MNTVPNEATVKRLMEDKGMSSKEIESQLALYRKSSSDLKFSIYRRIKNMGNNGKPPQTK